MVINNLRNVEDVVGYCVRKEEGDYLIREVYSEDLGEGVPNFVQGVKFSF